MSAESGHKPPQADEEDLAEQRRRANNYSEVFIGALVSSKLSTEQIRDEYAASDPAFVRKTTNLPGDYSSWRKLRGDGSCGLRALSFGYFELLAGLQDREVWIVEKARLAKLNGLLQRSGYDESIWEDWIEETDALFDDLAATNDSHQALSLIEERFNDLNRSIAILTHIRFLICFWLTEESQLYAAYLPDMSVEEYRKTFEPTHAEMDEVTLKAGYDMLLDRGGITVKVLYLDRSAGDTVTTHIYHPSTSEQELKGTVHFLYRPGHFDLLYPK